MPDTTFEKRTRSQVTLPDDILQVSQGSPLKDARIALRNHAIAAEAPLPTALSSDDTDDELLLSPKKPADTVARTHVTTKRSVSPPPVDEYLRLGSPLDGRELKRMKRDIDGGRDGEDVGGIGRAFAQRQTSTHTRNHSEPVVAIGKRSSRKHAGTFSRKPISSSSADTPPPSSPPPLLVSKGRAQSVPLFPLSYQVPHIDLSNPPASPRRPRSRSPSKEREPKLRITSATIAIFKALTSIPDEMGSGMDVDDEEPAPPEIVEEPSLRPPATSEHQTQTISPPTNSTEVQSSTEMMPLSSPKPQPFEVLPPPTVVEPTLTLLEPPSTPLPTTTFSASLSSPLTPLPESPLPAEIMSNAEERYTGPSSWGTDLETENDDTPASRMLKPAAPPAPKAQSRLPRLSFAANPAAMMGPSPVPQVVAKSQAGTSKTGPPTASSKATNMPALTGSKDAPKPNAFAVLMRNASAESGKLKSNKGKGKEKTTVGKATIPSSTLKPGPENTAASKALKMRAKDKNKDGLVESKPQKASVKAKMRPREKLKPKPALALVPVSGGETEDEQETDAAKTDVEATEGKKEEEEDKIFSPTEVEPLRATSPASALLEFEEKAEDLELPHTEVEPPRATSPSPALLEFKEKAEDLELPHTEVEPPRATSPAPTLPGSRPLSPQQNDVDLSMQDISINPLRDLGSPVEHVLVSQEELTLPQVSFLEQTKSSDVDPTLAAAAEAVHSELDAPATEPSIPETTPDTTAQEAEISTRAPPRAGGKLPFGKKRIPIAIPAAPRMTRSASSKQKEKVAEASTSKLTYKESVPVLVPPVKKQPKPDAENSASSLTDIATDPVVEDFLPAGSPMKICSPAKGLPRAGGNSFAMPTAASTARASLSKTPSKTKFSMKPASSPSPVKLGRAASMFNPRPPAPLVRASSVDLGRSHGASGSSLSTLSNALEKLRMPPPARPNTSMGFNMDRDGKDGDTLNQPHSIDDVAVGRSALMTSKPGLKRAATVEPQEFVTRSSKSTAIVGATTGKAAASTSKHRVQRSLASFMPSKDGPSTLSGHSLQSGTGVIMSMRAGKPETSGGKTQEKPRIFGVGGSSIFGMGARRPMPKASRNPGLPSVMASPMKEVEGANVDADGSDEKAGDVSAVPKADTLGDVFISGSSGSEIKDSDLAEILARNTNKARAEKERPADAWKNNASRRASMASHMLSQSLSALPSLQPTGPRGPTQPIARGLMGPPATPRAGARSSSSSYPSSSTSTSTSPGKDAAAAAPATRMSSRLAKTAPAALVKIKAGTGGHISSSRKGAEEAAVSNPAAEALKILKDCVIFVDVRTDDGEEAGSLFVEMLEGVGAKILTRVGQTCTHIVYKNGLMSTLSRYRLLRDPKPLVVGIAWVVECVEQRKKVDEAAFLVDLDGVNVAGTNKRRKSMLPKLISREILDRGPSDVEQESNSGDVSMDGSQSSITMDDDLPPLERARRRRSMLVGPL